MKFNFNMYFKWSTKPTKVKLSKACGNLGNLDRDGGREM